jgi:hypothetical protein
MTHPTEYLITCCGRPAPIDVELAPICKAIWAHGIHTQWTCQGDGDGEAVIAFPDIGEADRFGQLLFDFERMHTMRERGETLPERIPADKWKIETYFRFPLPQRATMSVRIPRADLPWLAEWLTGTPPRQLQTPPIAEPCEVHSDAGRASSEDEETFYYEFEAAWEILDSLDDGKCSCEPVDLGNGEVTEHDPDCPREYDLLTTNDDIANFRNYVSSWPKNNPHADEIARLTRIGVMARAIELERARDQA